jgi:hypothetical protein
VKAVKEFKEHGSPPSTRHKDELHALTNYIQSIMPMVRDRERLLLENHDLQQSIGMKEQAITALLGSRSMRITRPIRAIAGFLRRLSSRLKQAKSLTAGMT